MDRAAASGCGPAPLALAGATPEAYTRPVNSGDRDPARDLPSDVLDGHVSALADGPHGVVRHAGKVHFVRQVAPGDEIAFRPREDHGSYCFSDLVSLRESGPARRAPPCPWLPACGGCAWQHVTPEAQAQAKEANLRAALARIGGLTDPPLEPLRRPSAEFGYRRRLSLRVQQGRVGFHAAGSHTLVAIDECLLAAGELRGGITLAGRWVAELRSRLNRVEVASTGHGDRIVLVGQCDGPLASGDTERSETFLRHNPRLTALVLHGRGFRQVIGDDRVFVPVQRDLVIETRAGEFTQVNDAGNLELIRTVLALAAPSSDQRVADLYGGAGNFALPLARQSRSVHVVERARAAVASGRANAQRLGFANLTFEEGDVGRVLRSWATAGSDARQHLDLVVLDPPRSGAAEAIEPLLALAPPRILYVSCNPATLARDLRRLCTAYELRRVVPLDLFPQTPHLETASLLVRRPR